ncbi:unnamed protein product [Ascophyllum nodosum]
MTEDQLKCKDCVSSAAAAERQSAHDARKSTAEGEPLLCSVCEQKRPPEDFTNTQARKPDSSRKCRHCSVAVETAEAEATRAAREARLSEAQGASVTAAKLPKGSLGAAARLKAASAECALEAEKVTGLKPQVGADMKRGRGRGRGRGTWRGRASSGQRGRSSNT